MWCHYFWSKSSISCLKQTTNSANVHSQCHCIYYWKITSLTFISIARSQMITVIIQPLWIVKILKSGMPWDTECTPFKKAHLKCVIWINSAHKRLEKSRRLGPGNRIPYTKLKRITSQLITLSHCWHCTIDLFAHKISQNFMCGSQLWNFNQYK